MSKNDDLAIVIMGIATTSKPSSCRRILLDSWINRINGLKCCSDSKAITLSAQSSVQGIFLAVPFTSDMSLAALWLINDSAKCVFLEFMILLSSLLLLTKPTAFLIVGN